MRAHGPLVAALASVVLALAPLWAAPASAAAGGAVAPALSCVGEQVAPLRAAWGGRSEHARAAPLLTPPLLDQPPAPPVLLSGGIAVPFAAAVRLPPGAGPPADLQHPLREPSPPRGPPAR